MLSSAAIFVTLNSSTFTVNAENQKITELEQEQLELERKVNELSNEISSAESEMNSLDTERQGLIAEIATIQHNISEIIEEIEFQENEIIRLEEEIEALNKEIELLQEKIEERNLVLASQARSLQTDGSPENLIDLVLSAESLTELVGKIEVVNMIVKSNNTIMEEQIRDRQIIEENKAEIDLAKEETIAVKENMEANRVNLEVQKVALDDKVELVSEKYNLTASERDAFLTNQSDLTNQAKQLKNEIAVEKQKLAAAKAAAIAAEQAAEKARQEAARLAAAQTKNVGVTSSNVSSNVSSNTSSNPSPSVSPTPNSGGWNRPASGYVTSEFGYRTHPITGAQHLHGGIDIGGGGTIVAAKSGTVIVAGSHRQFGNYVKINHGNGLVSLYAHMQPNLGVSVGQTVSAGQRVGTMGTTGESTGVHLHFEIYENGRRVNPRNYVNF